jgi:hypothetical protein
MDLHGNPTFYYNKDDRSDPRNLLMDTVRLSLSPLEDELSVNDVVKVEATELYRLDNGEPVWGVNPTVLYTDNSTEVTDVVYDALDVPTLRYVVWDQCCVTGVDIRMCQCLKCQIYCGTATSQNSYTYLIVTEDQTTNMHYAHVCVGEPVASDTSAPPTDISQSPDDDHSGARIRHVLSPDFIRFINSTYTGSIAWTFESERILHGHSASDSEEIERLRHLHPHRWIHSGSNISIASSMPDLDESSDDGSDGSMPGLLLGMRQFVDSDAV